MISFLIQFLKRFKKYYYRFVPPFSDHESLSQQTQKVLMNQYQLLKKQGVETPLFNTGFRVYSQYEEDGLLLYVFTMIGFKSKKVVEMCCGGGHECMATNLILNHGFTGFLFDGNRVNTANAKAFFKSKKDCLLFQPTIKTAWINKENVNNLIADAGVTGEVDLLSLDIDGNDYWIWDAINIIQPRVCIFETQNIIPTNLSLTIPYDPNFNCWTYKGVEQNFRSVSLKAMVNLSAKKGYRLIGAHQHGFNIILLRNDIGADIFPAITLEEVHDNDWTKFSQSTIWPQIKNMPWQEV